jgi:hypothetical protein
MMRISFLRCNCFRVRVLLASSSLLICLLFAVNGLTPISQPSQKFSRIKIPISRSRSDSKLWMTTETTSNVVSSNDDDVNNNCGRCSHVLTDRSAACDYTETRTEQNNKGGVGDLPKLKKKLTREFFSIGFPAFIQLAAEPLAALVDTAYLGRFFVFSWKL